MANIAPYHRTVPGSAGHELASCTAGPLLSVITVCRNAGAVIADCIESVREQTFTDLEHVIVDGASTDDTARIISLAHSANGSRISRCISEPDRGIYDAMNKAISLASGRYLYFLNADDRLFRPDVVTAIAPMLATGAVDILCSKILLLDPVSGVGELFALPAGLERTSPLYRGIYQQALWTRRDLYAAHGGFDTDLRLCADVDWLMRVLNAGARTAASEILTTIFLQGGASSDRTTIQREQRRAERRHYSLAEWILHKCLRKAALPFDRVARHLKR